jgi:hypothetical protein
MAARGENVLLRVLVGKPEGKRPDGRSRRRWEDNVRIYLRELRLGRLNICSFGHQCNTFAFYFLLFVYMFRPHTAIFRCYSILSRSWCSVMPIFSLCDVASHVLLLMVCLLSVSVC